MSQTRETRPKTQRDPTNGHKEEGEPKVDSAARSTRLDKGDKRAMTNRTDEDAGRGRGTDSERMERCDRSEARPPLSKQKLGKCSRLSRRAKQTTRRTESPIMCGDGFNIEVVFQSALSEEVAKVIFRPLAEEHRARDTRIAEAGSTSNRDGQLFLEPA